MGLEGTGHGSGIRMEAAAYDGRDLAAAEGVTSSLCTWRQRRRVLFIGTSNKSSEAAAKYTWRSTISICIRTDSEFNKTFASKQSRHYCDLQGRVD